MPAINRTLVVRSMMRHEGLRLKPYRCTANKLTIGYGRNLEDKGISTQEAAVLLEGDVTDGIAEAMQAFPWLLKLDEVRAAVVIEMVVSIGLPRFKGFQKCIAAIEKGDYELAARELLDSKWRTDVGPTRSGRLAEQLRMGKVQAS